MNRYFRLLIGIFFISKSYILPLQDATNFISSTDVVNNALLAHVEFIHVYFTALSGNFHQLIIPIDQFDDALCNGLKFDGSSVPGCSNIFNSDMHLSLDFSSFFINPKIKNQPKTARIFASVFQDETTPYPADPRWLLESAMQSAHDAGYEIYIGPEIEFFLVEKNSNGDIIPWDSGYYFGVEIQQKHETIKYEILQTLLENGIAIEKLHHEVAPGQHEMSIHYTTPVKIADQIMLAKHIIKQVAGNAGLIATFMPKPFLGVNGSGMHMHISLSDYTNNHNLFFDEYDDALLSSLAYNCIAGILNRLYDGAVILNSSINSYKRLVPGYEAPVYLCWAQKNRSALIRIPQINSLQPSAARAEVRCPDALCNPYLACTLLVESCLAGIKNNEIAPTAIEENLFNLTAQEIVDRQIRTLPRSLEQAISTFQQSKQMLNLFNQTLIDQLVRLKTKEAMQFAQAVTNWEVQRYL